MVEPVGDEVLLFPVTAQGEVDEWPPGGDQFHRRGQPALHDGRVGARQVLEEIGHVAALVHALGVRQQPGIDTRAGNQKHPRIRYLLT